MLAGLPKAPSLYNPIVNPSRARIRQVYILDRIVETGFITPQQADEAKNTELVLQRATYGENVHAEYVGEMVRQPDLQPVRCRHLHAWPERLRHHLHRRAARCLHKAVRTSILNYNRAAAAAAPNTSSPCRPIRTWSRKRSPTRWSNTPMPAR